MKIIITGASGYVGQHIVPILKTQCEALLLVGRTPAILAELFSDIPSCTIEDLPHLAEGFDRMIHLAVLNNNAHGDRADFHAVNVELTRRLFEIAKAAGISRFYNVSSVHALDDRNLTPYAMSKREAVKELEETTGLDVINIYLPYIRGAQWNGKLAFLNQLPSALARPLETCLLALKPSVKVERLANFILGIGHPPGSVILAEGQSLNPAYKLIKRGLDLLFAFLVIGLLWWIFPIVWALIRVGSPGPGFFAQERVGKGGETFICYKFRTMQIGTPQAGTHEVSQSSVTPIGGFLRATKMDELPQVWNIVRNDMSLIGPRPGLPVQTELYNERQEWGVFGLKPGISGFAQVNNIDMSDPKKLAHWDARYIALQSLVLDAKIVLATVKGGRTGFSKKA